MSAHLFGNGSPGAPTGTGAGIAVARYRVGGGVALDSMRQCVALELTDTHGARGLFAIDSRQAAGIAVELLQRVQADPIRLAKRDPDLAATIALALEELAAAMRRR